MSIEVFFLYDTHCPWSYQTSKLVNQIAKNLPTAQIKLLHCGYFEYVQISKDTISQVTAITDHKFSKAYADMIDAPKNSTMAANLMSWAQNRSSRDALPLLNELFALHFEHGLALMDKEEVEDAIDNLKISPPAKAFKSDKFTKDSEAAFAEISEIQSIIGTDAIPALLLAYDDNLVLLNHNLYLNEPSKIVEAIKLQIA
jgi:protein-disulfide isomerase-like protein with CxxC motif